MRILNLCLLLLYGVLVNAAEPITSADDPIVIYQSEEPYEDVKSNLEMAITDQGLSITNTLHISEMLDRTAADTGLTQQIYAKAEALEFCSIRLSHQMSLAHPANMATCPITISIYQKAGDQGRTYIAYRRPNMMGDAAAAEQALQTLLDGIVQESLE